jgi:RHS repeat-associated protein
VGGLGHSFDSETGLIYMRARYMDPALGRFISEDPDARGPNLFVYCSDCPTSRADASGREDFPIFDFLVELCKAFGFPVPVSLSASAEAATKLCVAAASAALAYLLVGAVLSVCAGIACVPLMIGVALVGLAAAMVLLYVALYSIDDAWFGLTGNSPCGLQAGTAGSAVPRPRRC